MSVETSEAAITAVEDQFPLTSGVAFAKARERVLETGDSVLQAEKDVLYEVFPNGSRRRVKALQPSVHVDTGRKLRIT